VRAIPGVNRVIGMDPNRARHRLRRTRALPVTKGMVPIRGTVYLFPITYLLQAFGD
jgi:hypothetical protein